MGKDRTIVIEEREALVVRYIFDAFLSNTPLYIIKQTAREMGFKRGGSMDIETGEIGLWTLFLQKLETDDAESLI